MGKYTHYGEIDPAFKAIQAGIDDNTAAFWKLSLEAMKEASYQDLPVPAGTPRIPEDVQIEDIEISMRDGHAIAARVYRATNTPANAILNISYHGGGWTTGKHTYEELTNRHVAFTGRAVVLSPLYRLAPEHAFPQPFEDCVDTLDWAVANGAATLGVDSKRIVLSGSSAGGNLAAAVSLHARDQQIPGIVAQVLNIPAVCHPDLVPAGFEQGSLEESKLRWFWTQYVGAKPEPDVRHSPLLADSLANLPPALVQVAGADPLRDEGIEYGEWLKAAGNKVQVEVFKGVPHGFGAFLDIDAAHRYQKNVAAFIKAIDEGTFAGAL